MAWFTDAWPRRPRISAGLSILPPRARRGRCGQGREGRALPVGAHEEELVDGATGGRWAREVDLPSPTPADQGGPQRLRGSLLKRLRVPGSCGRLAVSRNLFNSLSSHFRPFPGPHWLGVEPASWAGRFPRSALPQGARRSSQGAPGGEGGAMSGSPEASLGLRPRATPGGAPPLARER